MWWTGNERLLHVASRVWDPGVVPACLWCWALIVCHVIGPPKRCFVVLPTEPLTYLTSESPIWRHRHYISRKTAGWSQPLMMIITQLCIQSCFCIMFLHLSNRVCQCEESVQNHNYPLFNFLPVPKQIKSWRTKFQDFFSFSFLLENHNCHVSNDLSNTHDHDITSSKLQK